MRLGEHGLLDRLTSAPHITVGEPMPFLEFIRALNMSSGVVTDSGGVQKQAYLLGVPCLTLRTTTEWTETLDGGWKPPGGPSGHRPTGAAEAPQAARQPMFGDGHAAERILDVAGRVAAPRPL